MEFDIDKCLHFGWYIATKTDTFSWRYLRHDLKFHNTAGFDGFWPTKAEAERYLMAYRVKGMKFGVHNASGTDWWYITANEKYKHLKYVWRDLELHHFANIYDYCDGYYQTQTQAEIVLRQFKEKHSMTEDTIKINVEINGETKPLHEISEQTLLRIREVSKPKPVPVFQVADLHWCGCVEPRLVLKMTQKMLETNVGDYIVLDERGGVQAKYSTVECVDFLYSDRRELHLDKV